MQRHPDRRSSSARLASKPMLTRAHAQVWSAIDRLAARAGLSVSELSRRAGLDPTTFNQSKRVTAQGRARWPSTESIARALVATDTSLRAFARLAEPKEVVISPRPQVAELDDVWRAPSEPRHRA